MSGNDILITYHFRQHLTFNENNSIPNNGGSVLPSAKKKRKTMKDGRPEPLIRQWYYSKIFHDLYTTKEAIALRKKIIGWKCSGNLTNLYCRLIFKDFFLKMKH